MAKQKQTINALEDLKRIHQETTKDSANEDDAKDLVVTKKAPRKKK